MDTTKHSSVFDPHKFYGGVAVVGVGALGSALALQLAKLDIRPEQLMLFDPDTVEGRNLPNQVLYGPEDVGRFKVDAACDMIERLTGNNPVGVRSFLTNRRQLRETTHVFVCVDSMAARRAVFDDCVSGNPRLCYYCEGRMGSRSAALYGFNPVAHVTRGYYRERLLYSDDDVVEDRAACGTVLSIGATASLLAAAMTWHFMQFCAGVHHPQALEFRADSLRVDYSGAIDAPYVPVN